MALVRWCDRTDLEPGGSQMWASACRTSDLALTMLFAWCVSAAAQDCAGREKLRAQSNEFRKEVIRVTDGVFVAVGYSSSNVIVIHGEGGGERQINAIARDYYLSSAMYLLKDLPQQ